ncbi:TetR/AcrR family transcriptional regulator [Rhodococcus phenolicus]|uniref:TetR/AcrR family transcriptional regulator n=1 Tax=Rhodococcus phenolicus TaxID=263849 RepID=UPI00082A3535|nr:TetR family transcriptional regulator [Rhodococcus phenolicus]
MAHRRSRRDLICEAALELAAEGGNHALTHQAIDARLGLARGSTSYYYRTRRALVSAAVAHLTARSRERFHAVVPSAPPSSIDEAAGVIAAELEMLLGERRRDVLARYALMADVFGDDELRADLASCLFSRPAASALMDALGAADATGAAGDLVGLLEGLVFDVAIGARVFDPGTSPAESLRVPVRRWIEALVGRH